MKSDNTLCHERKNVKLRVKANMLFWTGLAVMPAFLLNPSQLFRLSQVLVFILLAKLTGSSLRMVPTLLVSLVIVGFNLIIPYGRVLMSFGPWRLTEGALMGGIQKALFVQGLIILSRATIRSDLHLPSVFGRLLGRTFYYFDAIRERRSYISRVNIIDGIDRVLLESAETAQATEPEEPGLVEFSATEAAQTGLYMKGAQTVKYSGGIILTLFICFSWLLCAGGYFFKTP